MNSLSNLQINDSVLWELRWLPPEVIQNFSDYAKNTISMYINDYYWGVKTKDELDEILSHSSPWVKSKISIDNKIEEDKLEILDYIVTRHKWEFLIFHKDFWEEWCWNPVGSIWDKITLNNFGKGLRVLLNNEWFDTGGSYAEIFEWLFFVDWSSWRSYLDEESNKFIPIRVPGCNFNDSGEFIRNDDIREIFPNDVNSVYYFSKTGNPSNDRQYWILWAHKQFIQFFIPEGYKKDIQDYKTVNDVVFLELQKTYRAPGNTCSTYVHTWWMLSQNGQVSIPVSQHEDNKYSVEEIWWHIIYEEKFYYTSTPNYYIISNAWVLLEVNFCV